MRAVGSGWQWHEQLTSETQGGDARATFQTDPPTGNDYFSGREVC